MDGGGSGFIIVDSPPLSEALGDILNLVAYDFACVITFLLADKLTCYGRTQRHLLIGDDYSSKR